MRRLVWLALLLIAALALAWPWLRPAPPQPRVAAEAAASDAGGDGRLAAGSFAPGCPLPPAVVAGAEPLQTAVPAGLAPFERSGKQLQPLAGFSVDARVLGRLNYADDREARISPTDVALGWGRMREEAVLSRLEIGQANRWYHYRWRDAEPPLPPAEMKRSSANMHMIPASAGIAHTLATLDADRDVRIDGWLVEARAADGWRWRSSLVRDDTGQGACEVVYVCAVTVR